jgi:hypothetical protein
MIRLHLDHVPHRRLPSLAVRPLEKDVPLSGIRYPLQQFNHVTTIGSQETQG